MSMISLTFCKLAEERLLAAAFQIIPFSIISQMRAVLISQVVGFSLAPVGVRNFSLDRRLPGPLLPLVRQADPSVVHVRL